MREGVLLDEVYVPSGDSATRIYVVAEIRTGEWLKSLTLAEIGVACSDNSAAIHIAKEFLSQQLFDMIGRPDTQRDNG